MQKSAMCGLLGLLLSCSPVRADTVHLKNGRDIQNCVVVQRNEANVVITLGYGTIQFAAGDVKSIEELPVDPSIWPTANKPLRVPNATTLITKIADQSWATNFRQIPATVIDKGVLAHVPYFSYQCGDGYEMNIYGDPDDPACIEIGITGKLLTDSAAKSNCIQFIASMLGDKEDASVVRQLNRVKDLYTRKGLTFEITPSTAEDAYGGWWISVYDKGRIDSVRATPAELEKITSTMKEEPESKPATSSGSDIDLSSPWTPAEIRDSRKIPTTVGSGGGRVYVRGYYRKDGTYVRAHTRSRPR